MMTSHKQVVHAIGHGHIDPVWGWRWMEGCEEARATFRSVIQLMKEFPEFKFTASSAALYAWVEELEPALFEEIRQAVQAGRWELAGGWWVEPDCNIPHGESFVRHGLYSQRYFQSRFGRKAQVGFNPDSFGHAGSLPQILKKQGMFAYCYMRPNAGHGEMEYPNGKGTLFHWKAKDGSTILAANIPWSYGTWQWEILKDIEHHTTWQYLLPNQTDLLSFYGIGNHGGGPSRVNLRSLQEAHEKFPHLEIQCSTLTNFFEAIQEHMESQLPEIDYDLQFHAVGCYSAVSLVKRFNRLTEHQLMRTERMTTVDHLLNHAPCTNDCIEHLWREVLFNQFHDILAGSSIEKAYVDVRNSQGKVLHEGLVLEDRARQRLAARINTQQEGRSLVVFNPLPWDRTELVTASEDRFYEFRSKGNTLPLDLVDDQNESVPMVQSKGEFPGQRARAFLAKVPAMGYRTYRACEVQEPVQMDLQSQLKVEPTALENDFWRLELNPFDGSLQRLFDRNAQVEVLEKGYQFQVLADSSDTWSHGIRGYRTIMGAFGDTTVSIDTNNPLFATLYVRSHFRKSTQESWITLFRGLPTIEIRTRLNWQEQYACLKLLFTTCLERGVVTTESAYDYDVRPTDQYQEYPCQAWIDMTGYIDRRGAVEDAKDCVPPTKDFQCYGLAILNDGHYACDTRGKVMRMTILRSPPYRHHDPDLFNAEEGWAFTDQGIQEFRYRLVPHAGPWQEADLSRHALELNEPLYLHQESSHPGDLPLQASFLNVSPGHVTAPVWKMAEGSGKEMIVRLHETAGVSGEATLSMPYFHKQWTLPIGAHEIKTVRINQETSEIREVDLLEE